MSQPGATIGEIQAAIIAAKAASNGPHFTDPWDFLKASHYPINLHAYDSGLTSTDSTAGLTGMVSDGGVLIDSNWTANTYKTLLSVTGRGLVSTIIGPTALAGTPTTTFEITVDGFLTEVPITLPAITRRAVLGNTIIDQTAGTLFNGTKQYLMAAPATDANIAVQQLNNGSMGHAIPSWWFINMFGTSCLVFRKSLLIRAKTTENNSTTTLNERQAWVKYVNRTSS